MTLADGEFFGQRLIFVFGSWRRSSYGSHDVWSGSNWRESKSTASQLHAIYKAEDDPIHHGECLIDRVADHGKLISIRETHVSFPYPRMQSFRDKIPEGTRGK